MPKKVLFTSHTANFAKFNLPFMRWFQEQGWEVHYACGDDEAPPACDRTFCIPFSRSPYSPQNLRAYRELKRVIDTENYDIIHCHTPGSAASSRAWLPPKPEKREPACCTPRTASTFTAARQNSTGSFSIR